MFIIKITFDMVVYHEYFLISFEFPKTVWLRLIYVTKIV